MCVCGVRGGAVVRVEVGKDGVVDRGRLEAKLERENARLRRRLLEVESGVLPSVGGRVVDYRYGGEGGYGRRGVFEDMVRLGVFF